MRKINSDSRLITIFTHFVRQDTNCTQLKNKYKHDKLIQKALKHQEVIGIKQICHGKIAKSWARVQESFQVFHPTSHHTSIWSSKFIAILMKCTVQIWKTRNDINNKK